MNPKNNGGPAFPNVPDGAGEKWASWDEGMTLRDYFAAKFAVAWIGAITSASPTESRTDIASEANRLGLLQADAMLIQRSRQ